MRSRASRICAARSPMLAPSATNARCCFRSGIETVDIALATTSGDGNRGYASAERTPPRNMTYAAALVRREKQGQHNNAHRSKLRLRRRQAVAGADRSLHLDPISIEGRFSAALLSPSCSSTRYLEVERQPQPQVDVDWPGRT
jgi:hypothetical protein